MSERLKGKIGIVTGAGTGIGRACAIALAREGAQVALVGRRRDRVEEVTDEIGVSAFPIPADISRTSEVSVRGQPDGSVRVTKVGEWSSLRAHLG